MNAFLLALHRQRLDDHRYYHHSRINQSLHLLSAISFLVSYCLMFTNPAAAAMIGWLVAMLSRQVGHFFFEPKGYDAANQVTHEYKEAIKVGYNLRRKVGLMAIWLLSPLVLWIDPTLSGSMPSPETAIDYVDRVGRIWLAVGFGGLAFRMLQLCMLKDMQTGFVWIAKILTDPFHDLKLYYRSPLYLLRGELIDPTIAKMPH